MEKMEYHHPFCNGDPKSSVDTCKWCSGENGLLKKYGTMPVDEIIEKFFPNIIVR